MKPGQVMTKWWQDYVAGRLTTPHAIHVATRAENPDNAQASDRFFATPDDGSNWDAPERLKAPGVFGSAGYLRQYDRADWQHVDLRLMRWSALFIEYARKRGIPLYVASALRGEAEQNELVAQGRSKARYPNSAHNIGEAVDIVHSVFHWDLSRQEWALLHVLGLRALDRVNATLKKDEKLALDWGGSWAFYDPAHWQITGYTARVRRLPVGPPLRYTPRGILKRYRA